VFARFLIKPEGVTDRNFSGDRPGALVTYRSIAGGLRAKNCAPVTQPVTQERIIRDCTASIDDQLLCIMATMSSCLPWHTAGSVRYVWPIQQPVGDFDAQRKRMTALRERLGWPQIGCELIECYTGF
jgi:hypothetical protein